MVGGRRENQSGPVSLWPEGSRPSPFSPLTHPPAEAEVDFSGSPAGFIQSAEVHATVRTERRWDNWLDKPSKELRKDTV